MHNAEKWSDIFLKSCGVNTARFLKMFGHFSTSLKRLSSMLPSHRNQSVKLSADRLTGFHKIGILAVNV